MLRQVEDSRRNANRPRQQLPWVAIDSNLPGCKQHCDKQ
jgi:hypothetical protein